MCAHINIIMFNKIPSKPSVTNSFLIGDHGALQAPTQGALPFYVRNSYCHEQGVFIICKCNELLNIILLKFIAAK